MADSLFLLKKFPGLDHEYSSNFGVEADYWQKMPYKIRSINWLTILSETIIAELDGAAPIIQSGQLLPSAARIKSRPPSAAGTWQFGGWRNSGRLSESRPSHQARSI